jgi:hypothetical protein
MATDYTEDMEYALPRSVRLFARLVPMSEREAILGDLVEDAAFRGLRGPRRAAWLASECAAVAAGLTVERMRASIVVPPVREVVAGLAIDGRGLLRHGSTGAVLRALVFVGSVATLVLGVEVLVGSLMSAAGF